MADENNKPIVNFAVLRSLEDYVEKSRKFRTKCASFQIPGRDSGGARTIYIPYCNKQRFNFGPVLDDLRGHGVFTPPEVGKRIEIMDFEMFRQRFYDIHCPRPCPAYRNKRIAALVDRVKSFKSRITRKKWTTQEKLGLVAIPFLGILIAFVTPELRRVLHLDKTDSRASTTTNATGSIVNNGGVINNPTINNAPPPSKGSYELTDELRVRFLKLVSAQTARRDTLRIGCTSWSEASCVAAGRFLLLFSEAGWQIEQNKVFRLEPQIPIIGVAITTRTPANEPKEPLPPHQGRWRLMDESHKTIYWAFNSVGILSSGGTDDTLREGTLGIYFGSEPK